MISDRTSLVALIQAISERATVDASALERLAATGDTAALTRLLRAEPPECRALITPHDGVVRIAGDELFVVDGNDYESRVGTFKGTARVEDGSEVRGGQPLTEGELDLDELVRVVGGEATKLMIAGRLEELTSLEKEQALAIAGPMLSLLAVEDPESGERLGVISRARFGEAIDHLVSSGGTGRIAGRETVVGYDELAVHLDPALDSLVPGNRVASVVPLRPAHRQVCVIEGLFLGDASPAEFEAQLSARLAGARVQFLETVETLPSRDDTGHVIADTGGRTDTFFAVHHDDLTNAFGVECKLNGIRWFEDMVSAVNNPNGLLYPARVLEYACSELVEDV